MKYKFKKKDDTAIGYGFVGIIVFYFLYSIIKNFLSLEAGYQILIIVLLTIVLTTLIYYGIKTKIEQKKLNEEKFNAIKISNIDNMNGQEFENYIAKLLKNRGYSIVLTKGSGDLGVDIIAHSGLMKVAVQTKRYNKKVSRTAVSDAVAGMKIYNCNATMVITNNYFQKGAIELAKANNCKLIDRDILVEWILNNHSIMTKE